MRGRVFGAISAGANLAMPAGVLLGGFLIDGIGLRGSFAIIGTLYLAATLTLHINPAIRTMDSPPLPRLSQAAGGAFARVGCAAREGATEHP
jgi:MFS family permease